MKTELNTTRREVLKNHNSIANHIIKEKFVGIHVYCDVSSLAEYILKKGYDDPESPINEEEIENYYSYPKYYGNYASFDGGGEEERDLEIKRLHKLLDDPKLSHDEDLIIEEIEELEGLDFENYEIYEWWAVSEYLYHQLKIKKECVVDVGSCYIWGRTTTGQAILLDYVIGQICAEMEILEGQRNEFGKHA